MRGKGLFNALEFNEKLHASNALENLKNNGLLTNITKNKTLRLTPPLIINKNQINHALEIIDESINQ